MDLKQEGLSINGSTPVLQQQSLHFSVHSLPIYRYPNPLGAEPIRDRIPYKDSI